ncbi:hypothetical protein JMJ35_001113 [Cladonia borealis]|uniref:Uncharacterized protein n=1 Tax=Cladonia borealis TaxID=184061 RepID=A0AA39V9U0_9LECA|nr:hypothetical protein JMJ35_001113 [Cladonia borealis]
MTSSRNLNILPATGSQLTEFKALNGEPQDSTIVIANEGPRSFVPQDSVIVIVAEGLRSVITLDRSTVNPIQTTTANARGSQQRESQRIVRFKGHRTQGTDILSKRSVTAVPESIKCVYERQ